MSGARTLAAKDKTIRAAKYQGAGVNVEYRIDGIPGLVLIVQRPRKDGTSTKTWKVYYSATSESGRRTTRKLPLGRYPAVTLREAMERALGLRAEVKWGGDPVAQEKVQLAQAAADGLTFADLIEDYLRERRDAAEPIKSLDEVERSLRRDAIPALGPLHPQAIADLDIQRCVDQVAERGRVAAARHLLTYLNGAFNHAMLRSPEMRRKYNLTSNPAALVGRASGRRQAGRYGRNKPRERALADNEIAAFLNALECSQTMPAIRAVLRLLLLTGQRRDEVRLMTISELRLQDPEPVWQLSVDRTKNGRAQTVPLAPPVVQILRDRIGTRKRGYVFLGSGLELALANVRRYRSATGRWPWPPRNSEEYRVASFIAVFLRVHQCVNRIGKARLAGSLRSALEKEQGLGPLAFEMRVIALDVMWL